MDLLLNFKSSVSISVIIMSMGIFLLGGQDRNEDGKDVKKI